ncbi:MAG: hypothetical protein M3133_01155 [Actinomycetota bacterium]|nr:hypothetical protein [Actinomycetota bacterium]
MLASPVWRARPRQTWALATFTLGLLAGALTTGAALLVIAGLLSPLPVTLRLWVFLAIALFTLLHELGVAALPLLQPRWQVPREVFEHGLVSGSLKFGFELGLGFRTYVSASSVYVLAGGLALLTTAPLMTFAAAVGFGLGRATPPWMRYWHGRREAWDEALRPTLRWFKPLSLPLVTAALLVVSFAGS